MPSLRALGLGLTILLQMVSATPLGSRTTAQEDCDPPGVTKYPGTTPTLPSTGGATALPSESLPIRFIALGRGIQNYTCSAVGATGVAIGAVATLFDATALAFQNEAELHQMPGAAVNLPLPPSGAQFSVNGNRFSPLGIHFFDSLGTPTFDLSTVHLIGHMAKNASVPAPASAPVGPAKSGAVAWLFLDQHAGYTSTINATYRVETAGGNPLNCTTTGTQSVQYAAEYWFF